MTDSSIKSFIFYIFLSCSYFVLHVLNQVQCLMFVIDPVLSQWYQSMVTDSEWSNRLLNHHCS
ncbi:hypothetical protein Hanom_Chr08g00706621 [Helianthus anomalus]